MITIDERLEKWMNEIYPAPAPAPAPTPTYNMNLVGGVLKIGFGQLSQNDQIVKDVEKRITQLKEDGNLAGGEIIKINGPASLPVAMVIAHGIGHLYQAVACFDPKLNKYVVAIAHGNIYQVGDLVD